MTQLFLILTVIILCPVALFCQVSENFLAKLPKRSAEFLPESFLKPSPKKDISILFAHRTLKPLPVKWEGKKSAEVTPYGRQTPETITMISATAATARMKVMSQNLYVTVGPGASLQRRLRSVVVQGVQNLGTRNSAAQFYKRNNIPTNFSPRAVYEYQRQHDHLGNLGRQILRSVTQAARTEFLGKRFKLKLRLRK